MPDKPNPSVKTASGRPWIAKDVDIYYPQDGGLETSAELWEELQHPGFGGAGYAEQKLYQAVHLVEYSICRCKKRIGNRARVVVGDRLVSIRREQEGWVMTRHVKKPASWSGDRAEERRRRQSEYDLAYAYR
jgi:hypothetical protein